MDQILFRSLILYLENGAHHLLRYSCQQSSIISLRQAIKGNAFFFFFFFEWSHPQPMAIPWPGIESKPQLQPAPQLAATAVPGPEPTAPGQGLNPHLCSSLSRRSWIHNPLCHSRNSLMITLLKQF